jgi:hypothetical protein
MSSFENFEIASTNNDVETAPSRSFVVVSGLGGRGIRGWERNLNENPWWAACASSDNGVSDGALYCTFNYNGDPRRAYCEFVDRTNRTWDTFFVTSNNSNSTSVPAAATAGAGVTTSSMHEVAVARSADDVHVHLPTGNVITDAARLPFGGDYETRLTFAEVPLARAASAASAVRLQVLGAAAAAQPSMLVRAVVRPGQLTQAAVVWDRDDEDFETSTLWTSPDLLPLLREVAGAYPPTRVPTSVTLTIRGTAGTEVYASDHGDCFAPTLSIEF